MSDMKILIEGSGKHCHVTKETLEALYGKGFELDKKKMLSQPGQFASSCKITVRGPKGETKMSILGPCRKYNQIELSLTDARPLGIAAPVRQSGDLAGTPGCTLVGPEGEVELENGCIIALRHVHLHADTAAKWGIKDNEIIMVKCGEDGDRPLIFDNVVARVSADYADAMHVDYDELNAAGLLGKDPMGEIIKK